MSTQLTANWLGSPSEFMNTPRASSQVPRSAKYLGALQRQEREVGMTLDSQQGAKHDKNHDDEECKSQKCVLRATE